MTEHSIKCFKVHNENKLNQDQPILKLKHSISLQSTLEGNSFQNMSLNDHFSGASLSILSVSDIQIKEPDTESLNNIVKDQQNYNKVQNYRLIQVIGQGTFGTVYKALYLPTCKQVAVKIINFNDFQQDYKEQIINLYQKQVQILKSLHQKSSFKFTCTFYGAFQHQGCGYMIMQLLQGFSLSQLIESQIQLTLEQQKFYLASIVLALQQLHRAGCMHRDIKPQNIMISSKGQLYLLDFGCAKLLQKDQRTSSITGTCEYFSPSRFKSQYGFQADFWSFGVTAYELATKKLPFYYQGIQNSKQQQKYFRFSSIFKSKKCVSFTQLDDHNPKLKKLVQGLFNSILCSNIKQSNTDCIKNSLYFEDFNWKSLHQNKLQPPRNYSIKEVNQIRQGYKQEYYNNF